MQAKVCSKHTQWRTIRSVRNSTSMQWRHIQRKAIHQFLSGSSYHQSTFLSYWWIFFLWQKAKDSNHWSFGQSVSKVHLATVALTSWISTIEASPGTLPWQSRQRQFDTILTFPPFYVLIVKCSELQTQKPSSIRYLFKSQGEEITPWRCGRSCQRWLAGNVHVTYQQWQSKQVTMWAQDISMMSG